MAMRFGVPAVLLAVASSAPAAAQDVFSIPLPTDTIGMELGAALPPPEYYVVQTGDTLWDISSKFLGNPNYWPRLWSINDYITNPHWIYPGNRIAFRMGTLVEPPRVELETPSAAREGYSVVGLDFEDTDVQCGPDVRFTDVRYPRKYEAPAILAQKGDLEVFGRLRKARTMQTFLAERDLIYLDVDDPDAFTCGDVVSIYRRVTGKVRHPKSGSTRFGSVYRVVGEAKIVHRYEDTVAAVVRHSWTEAERGDLIGPAVPVAVEVEVGPPQGELDGVLLARLSDENFLMPTGETVFVDLGRADGVRVGNSFYVVEQRDENVDRKKEDRTLPPAVVGRLIIVRVDEYHSTAVVTDANKDLAVGMKVVQKVE